VRSYLTLTNAKTQLAILSLVVEQLHHGQAEITWVEGYIGEMEEQHGQN